LLQDLPLSLNGTAEVWYSTLDKSKFNSFDQLVQLFRARFLSPTANWVLRQELGQRRQGTTESLNTYTADIRKRCQRLGIPLSEELHYFINGLRPTLRNYVILQQPTTMEEAENAARIKDSLTEPTNPSLTVADVLALQTNLVKELEQKKLLAQPHPSPVAAYERPEQSRTPHNDDNLRRIIREELRSLGSNPREQPPPRSYFNNRGNFGRDNNRTVNGEIICHNCKRVGHHFRTCRLPTFRPNDPRIPRPNFEANGARGNFVRSPSRAMQYNSNSSN